jgi:transposase-like protein
MAVNRRIFTDEFKAEAVRLVTVEGHSARQVARDLDILGIWTSMSRCCGVGSVNWQPAKRERLEQSHLRQSLQQSLLSRRRSGS